MSSLRAGNAASGFRTRCASLVAGFYIAHGDACSENDDTTAPVERLVRLYWHLTPQAAAPWIAAATWLLNKARIPFELKALSDPGTFTRADAGVLYLKRGPDARIGPIVSEIYRTLAGGLRSAVPWFTLRIADGLAFAEDPAGASSFGQSRSRLVAEGLWDAYERGEFDREDRACRLALTFEKAGLDPLRPHLEPGSADDDPFGLRGHDAVFKTAPRLQPLAFGASARARISVFDAARSLGDAVCRSAFWDHDARLCNWMGRSMTAEDDRSGTPITPTSAALGPDLYAGSAGIALFLAQLFAMTGDNEHRRTALGAMARSLRQVDRRQTANTTPEISVFFGGLGVAWAAPGRHIDPR